MPFPASLTALVQRFQDQRDSYTAPGYIEAQLRSEFLDPFFDALGWDIYNRQGYAEAYKEVIHEDAVKVGTATKAPDYSFRIGGVRKFFVEAKKPSVSIKDDPSPAFQLRRYAWSAKLPLSILSNFAEFAVYDCRQKPDKTDKASVGRIFYFTAEEYEKRWEEIASLFTKEAILKGSFDKFASGARRGKGTAEVDDAFLADIEAWRFVLAKNIAIRNPSLTMRQLNFAVQRTIDRLIFLRICEDRGIEDYGRLQAHLNGERIYERFCTVFREADDRYNSGLFHFKDEKERGESPDTVTLNLAIDDKILREIVSGLYYPESPYEFSVLPADILGQVYEQFLGKVIRLTAGHQAKVEDKPEVRKAGGVFYTPTYIVDYIVKSTVGKLLSPDSIPLSTSGEGPGVRREGTGVRRELAQKEAAKLRILDPACGSGSFLIGAYQFLLDWHRDWYLKNDPEKWTKGKNAALYKTGVGEYRLTTPERKRILLNNIYGVDIDSQAVEVTKLSLLLKVLEGETEQTIAQQLRLFHTRALPDLGNNIKCGNSLIGTDFYEGAQESLSLFEDEEEKYRINAFDWDGKDGFPEIMKAGGFDAVIGNPPYVRIQTLQETNPKQVAFLSQNYRSASSGNYDIYVVFVERGLSLLNIKGRLGFILPHKFFNSKYGESLRGLIAEGKHIGQIVHFGDQQVFDGATTYTALMFLDKKANDSFNFTRVTDLQSWQKGEVQQTGNIKATATTEAEWNFVIGKSSQVFDKLNEMPLKLSAVAARIAQGIRTSANEVYVLDAISESKNRIKAYSKILNREVEIEREYVRPFLQGREIKSYSISSSGKIVIVPYKVQDGHSFLIPEKELKEKQPFLYSYLFENKPYLSRREKGRMSGANWYAYIYPKNIDIMAQSKILVPDIANRAAFALDNHGEFHFTSGYAITLNVDNLMSQEYILGLMNSRLLDYFLKQVSTPMRGGFFRYFSQFLEQLPIRPIDFSVRAEKALHDKLVSSVFSMLDLNKKLASVRDDQEKTLLARRIDSTDRQIDKLVYELYGLTEEEIKIVEGT